jgi:hypothetical protein
MSGEQLHVLQPEQRSLNGNKRKEIRQRGEKSWQWQITQLLKSRAVNLEIKKENLIAFFELVSFIIFSGFWKVFCDG